MTAISVGKAAMVGTAIVGISMAQMILTGVCLAVGFSLGGIIVEKIKKAVEDSAYAKGEQVSPDPEVVEA